MFAGDLGKEVDSLTLGNAFKKYPSFVRAKVVQDKRTEKSKGYGFVSFSDATDFMQAMKEMQGKRTSKLNSLLLFFPPALQPSFSS